MQTFVTERRPEVARICREYHVRRLAVFGSAVRGDFDPGRSDIDLLVEFEPLSPETYFDNKLELREALSRVFDRKVDLITWKSIRNQHFLREVEATQELLYAA